MNRVQADASDPSSGRGGGTWPLILLSHSPGETFQRGALLGKALLRKQGGTERSGSSFVLGLMGELGSGKTVFTKGLASGIGVQEWSRVTSPTFVLRQDYQGKLRIHHYDVHRLSGPAEFLDLGFADDLDSGAVVVVEWADLVLPAIPAGALLVEFEHWGLPELVSGTSSGDPGLRRITFRGGSVFWEETIRTAMS